MENVAVVSQDMLRSIRSEVEKKPTNKAAVLNHGDISRMKASAKIETEDEKKAAATMAKTVKEAAMEQSKARKDRMQAMDRERAQKVPPSDIEQSNRNKDVGILSKAQAQLDEELDDVKHMNQMVLYSKVVTIRDKQLEENKSLEKEWLEEQRKLDLMMEIERLKGLKVAEEREAVRQQARRKGALVIVDQIQEREIERIKQREQLVKEQEQMARQIENQRLAEIKAADDKRARNQRLIAEVEAANGVALQKKSEIRQRELEEEQKIVRYNQEKIEREVAQALEERRIKEEKEKEVARLREMQEKAADRQSEIDALRAKRAFEEGERQARRKEVAEKERMQRQAAELEVARKRQFNEREATLATQAKAERDDFLRIIERQKEDEQKERDMEAERQYQLRNHANVVRAQIAKNSTVKQQDRMDYLEEGKKVRQKLEDDRLKVEAIKQKKLG